MFLADKVWLQDVRRGEADHHRHPGGIRGQGLRVRQGGRHHHQLRLLGRLQEGRQLHLRRHCCQGQGQDPGEAPRGAQLHGQGHAGQ